MNNIFSIEKGIEVQQQGLSHWKNLLKPDVYKDLENWAQETNSKAENGYQIRRGQDLDVFLCNYKTEKMNCSLRFMEVEKVKSWISNNSLPQDRFLILEELENKPKFSFKNSESFVLWDKKDISEVVEDTTIMKEMETKISTIVLSEKDVVRLKKSNSDIVKIISTESVLIYLNKNNHHELVLSIAKLDMVTTIKNPLIANYYADQVEEVVGEQIFKNMKLEISILGVNGNYLQKLIKIV